jgi:hypothetical protein
MTWYDVKKEMWSHFACSGYGGTHSVCIRCGDIYIKRCVIPRFVSQVFPEEGQFANTTPCLYCYYFNPVCRGSYFLCRLTTTNIIG